MVHSVMRLIVLVMLLLVCFVKSSYGFLGFAEPLAALNKKMLSVVKINFKDSIRQEQPYQLPYQVKTFEKENTAQTITFADVAGLDTALIEVKEVVDFLKNAERFKALGAQMPRGILLEGPPGTGKTLIAKAIAHEAGCEFIYVSASEFVELYVGVGASRIRDLFKRAREKSPTIIFIDELDAVGAVGRGIGANEEYRQTLNQLLTELDGFRSDNSIMVLAATNYAAALDKALTRPGRFDRIIKVPLPDEKARKEILNLYIDRLPSVFISETCKDDVSKRTTGLGGADLKNIVNEAALLAVRDCSNAVGEVHLLKACEKVLQQRKR